MLFLYLLCMLTCVAAQLNDPRLQCYWRNGQPEPKGVPCNRTAALNGLPTPCCEAGHVCTSNGLCLDPGMNNVYTFSCSAKGGGKECGVDYCSDITNSGSWIQTCDIAQRTACCMTSFKPCCDDPSLKKFNNFAVGALTFVLDKAGRNLLGQFVDEEKGAVIFHNGPQAQTLQAGTPAVNNTNSCPTSPTNDAPTGQPRTTATNCAEENKSVRTALLAVGISLGILVAASIATAVFMFVKWTAERGRRSAPVPFSYEKTQRARDGLVQVPGTHEMYAGQAGPYEASANGR